MSADADHGHDHLPAPADHAPRKETFAVPDTGEIIVAEAGSETAWIQGDSREVRQ